MAEEKKSRLYVLKPLIERWPAVSKPEGHVNFRTKIIWTALCLIIYFILTNILIYGVSGTVLDMFAGFRAIMAGASGSIVHLGIGPIVTASIILQLFVGAKIINLDLTKKEDKAIYQGTQKVLVIVMILVEAIPQVYGYLSPSPELIGMVGGGLASTIIITQLFIGSFLVFLMDELISKWGIGSGISLFIAAGVSQAIFTGLFNWIPTQSSLPYSISNPPAGVIPGSYYLTSQMSLGEMVDGGFQMLFIGHQGFQNAIVPLIGTLAIFFIVVYTESSRIELPLAHGRVRGARGRYPIRLIYASNIPVILMAALLANINMFALLFYTHPTLSNLPLVGKQWWIGGYDTTAGSTQPVMGGAWYLSNLNGINGWLMPILSGGIPGGHAPWQYALKVIIYLSVMIFGSILFAKFWIETTDMGPRAVARQIQNSGMQIPGFRRDPRVLGRVLERYIPVVTIIGGAAVGALAGFADAVGTIGNASGTGVLLTVGIMINMYEQIAKEQAMEMHPVLRGFFGNE
ncbi:MAG: preprotein translocase subunit SecY [Candidatus Thermoplasmatota archaeon]|nr:preprotein translocase subunit SecY [Candidatus Thermoplasmatota archaeon]MBU1941548.1 preprotein translocase subunit SecY [Candidatus Thermoplasmatota archaeon]